MRIAVICSVLLVAVTTHGHSVTYQVGAGAISGNATFDPGLVLSFAPSSVGELFVLDDFQSHSFDFGTIYTNESSLDFDDWFFGRTLTAHVDFSLPEAISSAVTGASIGIRGIFQSHGALDFQDDPVTVTTSQGHIFNIWLEPDGPFNVFNSGPGWSLTPGVANGVSITATVQQVYSTPTPAAAATGAAMLGLLTLIRRRRTRASWSAGSPAINAPARGAVPPCASAMPCR